MDTEELEHCPEGCSQPGTEARARASWTFLVITAVVCASLMATLAALAFLVSWLFSP
jgi:hypothetical protein